MRHIQLTVQGSRVAVEAGDPCVAGEGNSTGLRVTFDGGWDGLVKTAVFWDALGANPVRRILTDELLASPDTDTRTYLVPIPAEPLALAGEFTLVLDGAGEGVRLRTLPVLLPVADAPASDDAAQPADPAPTQAEQLQSQLDHLTGRVDGLDGRYANVLTGTARGSVLRLEDISPLQDTLPVTVTGVDDPAGATLYAYGPNLFDATAQKISGISTLTGQGEGTLTVGQSTASTYISANFALPSVLAGHTVTLRAYAQPSGDNQPSLRIQWTMQGAARGGMIIQGCTPGQAGWITVSGVVPERPEEFDELARLTLMLYSNGGASGMPAQEHTVTYSHIQLELGDTATEYCAYRTPVTHTPDGDGLCTVAAADGLTLLTDTEGAVMECEYNRDINKAYDTLVQAILSMGGNV